MGIAIALAAPSPGYAADLAAASSANLVEPIWLLEIESLDFGIVAASGSAGTATLELATNSVIAAGGVSIVAGGVPNRATVNFNGTAGTAFTLTLPESFLVSDGFGQSMTVDSLTLGSPFSATILPGGITQLDWGATLHVGAGQAVGSYSGTYDVTAFYD